MRSSESRLKLRVRHLTRGKGWTGTVANAEIDSTSRSAPLTFKVRWDNGRVEDHLQPSELDAVSES
jgi:hypothetical protein